MEDDRQTHDSGPADRRIDIDNAAELREWAESLGVTPRELEAAVRAVGPSVARVMEYFAFKE
jgi:hypothetical protein